MTATTANFSPGVNGATIATGDAGAATAWNGVLTAAGNTCVYDNTHVLHSTLAAKITSTTGGQPLLYWNSTAFGGTVADMYGRVYFYIPSYPLNTEFFCLLGGSTSTSTFDGTSTAFTVLLNHSGQLFAGGKAAGFGAMTNSVPLNQWFRVEWHVVGHISAGSVELKLFSTADSATATETSTYTSRNTGGALAAICWGAMDTVDNKFNTLWLAQAVANASAYPGSFPVNTVAPAVSGSTPVGSTLTCDGGTWNGTFTLTYQWSRDGSNIAAATSSTYVTVSADSGHAIGCTVTATGQQATNESATQASSNTVTAAGGSTTVASDPNQTVFAAIL